MAFCPAGLLFQPARRPRDRARLWTGISGRHRSRAAAGILARRYRLSCRGQPSDRRLLPVTALFGCDALVSVSAGTRHRRRPAGGARRAAHDDGVGLCLLEPRVRPTGAGAAALGAAAARYLAPGRPEPAERLVCLVDRSRTVAAHDAGGDRPVAAGRRLHGGDRARPPHPDVVRSAVRAACHCGAGVALFDLADPRRCARRSRVATGRGAVRQGHALGLAGWRPCARDERDPDPGAAQSAAFQPHGGSPNHLPATGRSLGTQLRLCLCHRAGAGRQPDLRRLQSRPCGRRAGRCDC